MPATLSRPVSYGPSSAADPAEGRNFGGAFWLATLLHLLAVALIVLLTIALRDRIKEEEKTFKLVAGPGDDFMATEAPAGSEGGQAETGEIAFNAPPVPTWTPPAPPPPEQATPVTPVTPVPTETVRPVVETPPTPAPNFTRQLKRTLQKEKAKTEREIQKQRAAEERAAKERELADKRLSYSEYMASLGKKTSPAQKAPAPGAGTGPRIDANAIKKGVTGATGAGSKGAGGTELSAAEGAAMQRYDAMLKQRLRDAHEKPGGLSDLLTADVQFTMAANGSFSGIRIVRSSGNADFDQSVLEAFARVKMPPRPDGKTEVITLTFRMKEI